MLQFNNLAKINHKKRMHNSNVVHLLYSFNLYEEEHIINWILLHSIYLKHSDQVLSDKLVSFSRNCAPDRH